MPISISDQIKFGYRHLFFFFLETFPSYVAVDFGTRSPIFTEVINHVFLLGDLYTVVKATCKPNEVFIFGPYF